MKMEEKQKEFTSQIVEGLVLFTSVLNSVNFIRQGPSYEERKSLLEFENDDLDTTISVC